METFIRERFGRNNLIIGVVGDVTPDILGKLLDETFSELPTKAVPWKVTDVEPVSIFE